ncbi:MAG TPA: hypothetical protein VLJ21_00295 [Candidatus Binatia bacterium]|nr:hypothetical protein [Candidatus Binatia bacterium]
MRRKTKRNLIIAGFIVLLVALGVVAVNDYQLRAGNKNWSNAYTTLQSLVHVGNLGSTHEHADFAMYINGKQIDFTKPEYLHVHPLVHIHGINEGESERGVIHKHATGVTYGMFFRTLGITIDNCLTINEKEFCDTNGRTLKYYLNGGITPNLADEEIHDLDKVLISYGSESLEELQQQLASIPNNACVQSKTC